MNKEEEYMDWEKDAPFLASLKKEQPFKIPGHYFEDLTPQIISEVKLESLKQNLFTTPENYFSDLKSQLFSQIILEEIKEDVIKENAGFSVPSNYFNESSSIIQQSVTGQNNKKRILKLSIIRYAAAACILLTTSFGIYFNIQQTSSVSSQLSEISNDELENYLQQHTDATDLSIIIDNLEDKSIFDIDKSQLSSSELNDLLELTP
ncbi:MAG: hypothetical protein ABIP95_15835 [Pelobium sp.]